MEGDYAQNPSMSVIAILQQQSFRDSVNSTPFIDLPVSPT
jgi:hypothetical protein